MIATISSDVPTGRSMKIRDGFMSRSGLLVGLSGCPASAATPLAACPLLAPTTVPLPLPLCWRLGPVGLRRAALRRGRDRPAAGLLARAADLGAVAQPVDAVDHHLVADRETLGDGDLLAVGRAGFDQADGDGVVGLHEIDEGAGLAALDRGDRDGDGVLHRVGEQTDI